MSKEKEKTEIPDKLLDHYPMRMLCIKKELEFWLRSENTVADKVEMFQGIVNSLRVYEYSRKAQDMCQILYKQGVLYDHTRAALRDGDENEWAKAKRTKEEIMADPVKLKKRKECDCGKCNH